MIWLIIKKEIYTNFLTSRLIVGTLLTVILVVTIIRLQIDQYSLRMAIYTDRIRERDVQLKKTLYNVFFDFGLLV